MYEFKKGDRVVLKSNCCKIPKGTVGKVLEYIRPTCSYSCVPVSWEGFKHGWNRLGFPVGSCWSIPVEKLMKINFNKFKYKGEEYG